MTRQSHLKKQIRARMEKTGERYSTARAHVLGSFDPTTTDAASKPAPGMHNSYLPGVRRDTTAATNLLRSIGVRNPNGDRPLSEAMFTGIAGGVGFLYIVFEYPNMPPLLSVLMRYDTAADQFAITGLRRLGLGLEVSETTSAAKAQKTLDAALSEGRPALCVVDLASLGGATLPGTMAGMAPTVVVVTERNGDDYDVDLGLGGPFRMTAPELARARASYKQAKHRMAVATRPEEVVDLAIVVDEAIAATIDRYENAPYKGFASNFGFAGMRKWVRLLTDPKDKKGWPTIFPEGERACIALRRAYQGLEYEMTPPAGGRGMYAAFLREAAALTGYAPYASAAEAYDQAASAWTRVSTFIAECDVPEVATGCEMLDAYAELLDEQAGLAQAQKAADRVTESTRGGTLPKAKALEIYAALAGHVEAAIEAEEEAVRTLREARAGR